MSVRKLESFLYVHAHLLASTLHRESTVSDSTDYPPTLICAMSQNGFHIIMEKLSGASIFCLFGQDAKISLAQIILGSDYRGTCERTTSVSFEISHLKEIS